MGLSEGRCEHGVIKRVEWEGGGGELRELRRLRLREARAFMPPASFLHPPLHSTSTARAASRDAMENRGQPSQTPHKHAQCEWNALIMSAASSRPTRNPQSRCSALGANVASWQLF
jgi:hypothetical protein